MQEKHLSKFGIILGLMLLGGSLTAAIFEQVNTTSSQTLSNKTYASPIFSGTATGSLAGLSLSSPTFSGTAAGTLTNLALISPVLSGTTTGTYTLGGTPTISSPILSGTATGTYTLGGTPTISSPILSGTTSGTATLGGALTYNTSVVNGHYIGSPDSSAAVSWTLSKTGAGSGFLYGFYNSSSLTGGANDSIIANAFNTSITKAASGTHSLIDGVFIGAPTISGAATATVGSTLRISGAPSAGASTLYALWVAAGTSRFGGQIDIADSTAGQIKFPVTQNSSANANTLDDYEEGTWTPSVGGTATYTTQTGSYTKIGRMVCIHGTLVINVIGTGSTATVSGLPFTTSNTTFQPLVIAKTASLTSSIVSIAAVTSISATEFVLYTRTAASTSDAGNAILGNASGLSVGGCYQASA